MKPIIILAPTAATLVATLAFAEGREDYSVCAEEHLLQFLDAALSAEQAASHIIDLHCDVEAIEFAQILAKAQSGSERDAAAFIAQINLLRSAVEAEIRRRRDSRHLFPVRQSASPHTAAPEQQPIAHPAP